jgi:hypothetical protein
VINGPSEGLAITVAMLTATWAWGDGIWQAPVPAAAPAPGATPPAKP